SVVACSGAFAQFVPDTPDVISVEQLLKNGKNNDRVALEGRVTKELWHEKYMFEDATGTVKVKIDDKLLYGKPIDSKTKVRIEGEFEREFMETDEVEVKTISVIE
ncbi:MAG: NirD/YgiW/YdeI family stress tolerance protein, partial [Sutterellaceae bacterium]|nr:NirD/YgiW/YdeI family stress tolerance protein [Sutterellaceae bacterium]